MAHLLKTKKYKIQTGKTKYFYRNESDKACFQHDMTYGGFKDLARRTASGKVLRDKAFDMTKNLKHDGYQGGIASVIYKFFDKKSAGSDVNNESKQNLQLAEGLHKAIIKKFKERTVYYGFKDNIWGVDLAGMQSISKLNKEFRFLLCVIDIFNKYAWVVPVKDNKGVSIINAFQKVLDKSDHKPNKILVDKGSEFCKSYFKK